MGPRPPRDATPLDARRLRQTIDRTAALQHTADLALQGGDAEMAGQILTELHSELTPVADAVKVARPPPIPC